MNSTIEKNSVLILEETVCIERVKSLINHPDVIEQDIKLLKSYLKNYNKGSKKFRVSYSKKGCGIGRRYAEKSLSLQNFSRNIRQSLVYDTHLDIDIKNCGLTILSQYCEKNNIQSNILNKFNEKREENLNEIMQSCNISRDLAKNLILKITFLGSIENFITENEIQGTIPKFVYELRDEFKIISNLIVALNKDLEKQIKKFKDKDFTNPQAQVMAIVYQDIEDNILMNAKNKLTDLNFQVETLIFDGCLILKKNITKEDLIKVSDYCFEKTNYRVEFEIKKMKPFYEYDIEEKVYDFSNYDFKHIDYYNQLYCSQLKGKTQKETYELRKTYIELFLCKIITPDTCFIFQNGNDKTPNIYSPQSVSSLLKPIESGFFSQMNNPINFWDKWSSDPNQKIFRKYDFIPYNINQPDEKDIYNLFMGMNENIYGKIQDEDKQDKLIKPYLDITLELCGGNEKDAMYFHKFIANIFQKPTERPPIAILFKGKQGTGKNVVLDCIGNMIGKDHYITSSKPSDFFSDHAEGAYRKLLVNVNKAESKDTFQNEGQFKSFITEDTIVVNPKYVRPTKIANHARLIITSNKPNPIPIDVKSKDRRYVVYQTTDKYLEYKASFWEKLVNHFKKPEFMTALHYFFLSLNLEKFDWIKNRPITKAYKEMCNMFSPTEALFWEHYIDNKCWNNSIFDDDDDDDDDFENGKKDKNNKNKKEINIDIEMKETANDIFKSYESFCKEYKFFKENQSPNIRAFNGRLIDLELPMKRFKIGGVIKWVFNPNEIYNFLIMKKWIGNYNDDEDFEEETDKGIDMPDSYFDV